jgi:fucose 4-O-acetylase-like acetyltransferase
VKTVENLLDTGKIRKPRDYSLDAIKGIACIFMILAHAQIQEGKAAAALSFLIGGLAPTLFFAVSGVTTTFQINRTKITPIAISYLLLSVLGFSYNTMWRPYLWTKIACDIFQIIAIGVIAVSYLEQYIKPKKIYYLLLSIAIFCIHHFVTHQFKLPPFPFRQFLFAGEWAGFTFPIFPWLGAFFAGVFAYNCKKSINLVLASIYAIALVITFAINKDVSLLPDKVNVSLEYYFFSYSFLFFSFYLFRKFAKNWSNNVIVYIGKNSLLFLYVHVILLRLVFPPLGFNRAIPVWIASLILSVIIINLLERGNIYLEKYFQNFYTWGLIAILTCAIPLIIPNETAIKYTAAIIGLLFAANYHSLSQLVKQKFSQSVVAG